jgi:uncharacterized protein (DUF1800 family)
MLAATIALSRFGLGARPEDQPPADPKRWLIHQMDLFQPRPQALAQAGRFAAMRGRKQLGLNENLAREIMELHTLGVRDAVPREQRAGLREAAGHHLARRDGAGLLR